MAVALCFAACNTKPAVDLEKEKAAVLSADKAFNDAVAQDGLAKAMEKFYDDNVVGLIPDAPATVGKAATLKSVTEGKMDQVKTLSWKPEKAELSSSGDLGYTWGYYQLKDKTATGGDTTYYGVYSTVWKKAADGSWKAVLDHNSQAPKP